MAKSIANKQSSITVDDFEKLILSDEKKISIISIIKQYKESDKLFKRWGLNETIEYGRGMTMLFWGQPGTGKTHCAKLIAKILKLELAIIKTSQLQSPVPGEMERGIEQIFSCDPKKTMLLLDECDSLLMSRDNVGMLISSEINCLLTEIEKFEGICILTTNRISELDEALERRISLIMSFPLPGKKMREDIWKMLIPKKLPLAKDVDFAKLSESQISGGHIKNAILNAARLAIAENRRSVNQSHFTRAIESIEKGSMAFKMPSKTPTPYVRQNKT